jgi:hypothetical protein
MNERGDDVRRGKIAGAAEHGPPVTRPVQQVPLTGRGSGHRKQSEQRDPDRRQAGTGVGRVHARQDTRPDFSGESISRKAVNLRCTAQARVGQVRRASTAAVAALNVAASRLLTTTSATKTDLCQLASRTGGRS